MVAIDGREADHFAGGVPGLRATRSARETGALPLPDRPSIAVLPFDNMSDDPDQEYFADGISEDLITALSRIRWLFVIARNSTFVYRHRAVDVRQVARDLGVRYVLEGSVRRAGNRLRITAQLIDALTGVIIGPNSTTASSARSSPCRMKSPAVWSGPSNPACWRQRAFARLSRSSDDLGAWELVARAQTQVWRVTRADYATAIDTLKQTVEIYPDYAPARSLLAFRLLFAAHMGWVDRGDRGLLAGRQHAVRAMALDDGDSWGQIALGYLADDGKAHRGVDCGLSAARSNSIRSSAAARGGLGHCLAFAGWDREAIEHAEEAIRLSPLDPDMAIFLGGHRGRALFRRPIRWKLVRYAEEQLRLRPGFHGGQRLRCASLAQSGRIDEARNFSQLVRKRAAAICRSTGSGPAFPIKRRI